MSVDLLLTAKPLLYWLGVGLFLGLEWLAPYRPTCYPKLQRWRINIPLSLINGIIYHLCYTTVLFSAMAYARQRRIGLLHRLDLPDWLAILCAVLLLDLTIYFWHLANHLIPLFWRFHRVHHSDLEMDVSTSNRFHLGELLLSGIVRLGAVVLFGITPTAYLLFELGTNIAIQFHHSSLRVPHGLQRVWMTLFVPPDLHRIHHSVKIKERDSNYGVIFSLWDRIFGTLRHDVPQTSIVIGLGSHRQAERLGFLDLWRMPFTHRTP